MTQKEDLEESISQISNSDMRVKTIVTEVHGGRRQSVPVVELANAISKASGEDPLLIPEPSDAMDIATAIALEKGCMVYVTGSIYLVGKIIKEHASREGANLWDFLAAHPPRDQTEG
jgi:folylpolyglutamate synthase/dihydropteroate synthase